MTTSPCNVAVKPKMTPLSHLCDDDVGINHVATVDDANDPMHTDVGVFNAHFRNLADNRMERLVQRHAACAAGSDGLGPVALVGEQPQHARSARSLVKVIQAKRDRIETCRERELIDEAFSEKGIEGVADAAPETDRYPYRHRRMLDPPVLGGIRQERCTIDGMYGPDHQPAPPGSPCHHALSTDGQATRLCYAMMRPPSSRRARKRDSAAGR